MLRTNARHAKFHCTLRNEVREKHYKICLHPSGFLCPRGSPWATVHQSRHCCTARPGLPMCQILSPFNHLSTRYLLPNYVDFRERVSTDKNPANDISLHTMQRQQVNTLDYTIFSIVILLNITTAICHVRTALQNAYNTMQIHRESKKGCHPNHGKSFVNS